MSMNKPSESEDEYFAREEAARLYRLTLEKRRQMAHDEEQALKALHWMHCPKCGTEMKPITLRDVTVERCFHCHGTFFDEIQLNRLVREDSPGLLEKIAAVFRTE